MKDVPLSHAMICWNPAAPYGDGRIAIVSHPDDVHECTALGLSDTAGCCYTAWEKMTRKEQLLQLYVEAWHCVCRDGLNPSDVHKALSVIPEYRQTMSGEKMNSWARENSA